MAINGNQQCWRKPKCSGLLKALGSFFALSIGNTSFTIIFARRIISQEVFNCRHIQFKRRKIRKCQPNEKKSNFSCFAGSSHIGRLQIRNPYDDLSRFSNSTIKVPIQPSFKIASNNMQNAHIKSCTECQWSNILSTRRKTQNNFQITIHGIVEKETEFDLNTCSGMTAN